MSGDRVLQEDYQGDGIRGCYITTERGSRLTIEPTSVGDTGALMWPWVGGEEQPGVYLTEQGLRWLAYEATMRADFLEQQREQRAGADQ